MNVLKKSNDKTKVTTTHVWTLEKLRGKLAKQLLSMRAQSIKHGAADLTVMCDAVLLERAGNSSKPKKPSGVKTKNHGAVTEYHFVYTDSRGVTVESDGTFRTGSWVVSEARVKESQRQGALVALHESKAERSYRHGTIIDYRITRRDMIDKDNVGIEFHVQPTGDALAWVGGGSGEKGYRTE